MRFVIQNISDANIKCFDNDGKISKDESIWKWIVMYLGVSKNDELDYVEKIGKFLTKLKKLRFLKTEDGRLEATLNDIDWEILVVSNFTLYANSKKWSKMDFGDSAKFDIAKKIYDYFLWELHLAWFRFITGEFWAMMKITSTNDWPVNYVLDY